jgi:hypothetical protein
MVTQCEEAKKPILETLIESDLQKWYNDTSTYFPPPKSKHKEICPDLSTRFYFHNRETDEYIRIPCNRYSCPVCGRKKIQRLYAALFKYFSQYKFMRLFTFTIRYQLSDDPQEHYKILSKCFALFIKEIRRSPMLSEKQQRVKYVRCIDFHKTGFTHYHGLFSEFIPIKVAIPIWRHVVQKVTGRAGHVGSVVAVGMLNAKNASSYICKYVCKAAQEVVSRWRRYSKSGRLALFDIVHRSGKWSLVIADDQNLSFHYSQYFSALKDQSPDPWSSYFTSTQLDITTQNFSSLDPENSS